MMASTSSTRTRLSGASSASSLISCAAASRLPSSRWLRRSTTPSSKLSPSLRNRWRIQLGSAPASTSGCSTTIPWRSTALNHFDDRTARSMRPAMIMSDVSAAGSAASSAMQRPPTSPGRPVGMRSSIRRRVAKSDSERDWPAKASQSNRLSTSKRSRSTKPCARAARRTTSQDSSTSSGSGPHSRHAPGRPLPSRLAREGASTRMQAAAACGARSRSAADAAAPARRRAPDVPRRAQPVVDAPLRRPWPAAAEFAARARSPCPHAGTPPR